MFEKNFRVFPNGPIRSQNFVLIIFPRKFGPIRARCIVYILMFTEILAVILIIKAVDIFGYFQVSTTVMIEPGKEPSKIYEQKK